MKKHYLFFLLLFMLLGKPLFAQTGTIKGSVTGINDRGAVIVSLLHSADSTLVKNTFCEQDGKFEFVLVKEGSYFISITHIGYESYSGSSIEITVNNNVVELPVISMKASTKNLQEVQVNSKRPFVQRKIDRVLINPDALIGNAGATAMEVLEKAPGVLVDINGNISLKGKQGVLIFIDDKPSYLSAADLAGYLKSLPAGTIETVELMTNPPAKYDAAGNAGIINIKLKKNQVKGFNGGLNLGYGQGRYLRTNNSFNLNYRVNKFNFFTNVSIGQNNSYQDLTIKRYYYAADGTYSSGFIQNSYLKKEQGSFTARLGVDYYASNKTTIGAVASGFINPSFSPVKNNAQVLDENNEVVSLLAATNPSRKKWKNGTFNINYAYKIDNKGKELSANVDYIHYNSTYTQTLENNIFSPDNVFLGKTILQSSLPASINIQTAKVDYVNPLKAGAKFDAGFKTSFVNTDNTADFFDVVNNVQTPNYQFSNRFKYKENINAVYLNYSKDWKYISLQTGLRLENTNIKGNQLGNPLVNDSAFSRHYTNLFPTVFIVYRLDSMQKNQIGFSIGRRIDRPNYQDLNPFTYPLDRFTYYGGNPFLVPTFSYGFELSHTYKNFLTTSLEYNIIDDLIQETNEQRGTVYYSRPGNFGKQVIYGISVNGNFQLTKWWVMQLYTEYKNMGYKSIVYGQTLNANKFYWYVGPTLQFTVTKSINAELGGSYQTRILAGQFLTIPVWQMRAGVSKKILKGKGTVKLNFSDIFYTNQPGGDINNIANSKANWLSLLDSRVVTVGFSYRFNKGKSLNARQSGGSDAEKGRVKTN
ncbi:MAG: outer membrane beta-barrel family protein [Ferruginibacter sp.]